MNETENLKLPLALGQARSGSIKQTKRMDPFVYNFVLGGAIFVFGAVLAWRQGSLGLSGRSTKPMPSAGSRLVYFILQAFLQYKAPGMVGGIAAGQPNPEVGGGG